MNSAEKQAVLHCLKVTINEAFCADCPLYGMNDYCENDCIRLAINALEQEPCTDAISREAVIDIIEDVCPIYGNDYRYILREKVNELSSVTPQYTEAEIQRMQELEQAEIQKAYEIGRAENIEVLDKIRAEIDQYLFQNEFGSAYRKEVSQIIDKYKASPTGAEGSDNGQ